MKELAGKVAIVTGATRRRGLGRALALALADAGADVVVTGTPGGERRLPRDEIDAGWRGLPSMVEELEAAGVRALGLAVDVARGEDVERMVARTVETLGRVDVLVANAAYPRGGDRVPLVDLPEQTWRTIVDVNLTGTMLCCQHVARRLIAQGEGGSLVAISSIAAMTGTPTFSAYAASKAAVHALNGTLAAELGPHGITCNVVAPGFIDTARIDVLRTPEKWAQRTSTIPLGRAGTPDEIAALVRFLCGPSARWISGEVFAPSGGEVRRTAR